MKFRRLTLEELNELEKEFIEFLIVNGIEAQDWTDLKENEPDKAEKIVEQFSDVVFTSIFRKNQFVDLIAKNEIRCFQFLENKVVLVGVKSNADTTDFRKNTPTELSKQEFEVYNTDKTFSKSREEEMFELIENGATLSDGSLFKNLCLAL